MDNDAVLIAKCQECMNALHRFKAIFRTTRGLPLSEARKLEREDGERADNLYTKEVEPLLEVIAEMPAVTIAGFAAKTQVFLFDDVTVTGSDHAEAACAQMLEDLARQSPLTEPVSAQQKAA